MFEKFKKKTQDNKKIVDASMSWEDLFSLTDLPSFISKEDIKYSLENGGRNGAILLNNLFSMSNSEIMKCAIEKQNAEGFVEIEGYKFMNADLTCRDFQFSIGETYSQDGFIGPCHNGFHFCRDLPSLLFFKEKRVRLFKVKGSVPTLFKNRINLPAKKITILEEVSFYNAYSEEDIKSYLNRAFLKKENGDFLFGGIRKSRGIYLDKLIEFGYIKDFYKAEENFSQLKEEIAKLTKEKVVEFREIKNLFEKKFNSSAEEGSVFLDLLKSKKLCQVNQLKTVEQKILLFDSKDLFLLSLEENKTVE